jgi:hypothetical protein
VQLSITFSCTHRYTGLTICAIPCDGRADLCKYYDDENCKTDNFTAIILCVSIVALGLLVVGRVVEQFFGVYRNTGDANETTSFVHIAVKEAIDYREYCKLRKQSDFGNTWQNLILYSKYHVNVTFDSEICLHYYSLERQCHANKAVPSEHTCSSKLVDFFTCHVDKSLLVRAEKNFAQSN